MSKVFGPKSWVFWWALLTATVFLPDALRWQASLFRNKSLFAPTIPPFNLVGILNSTIDGAAEWIRTGIKFKPNDILIAAGPVSVPNWSLAVLAGIVLLAVAAVFYVRALKTSSLLDDILALVLLYFVIRMEAHLFSIASLPLLSPGAKALVGNQLVSFLLLLFLLAGLTLTGGGIKDPRSFWRGLIEFLLVAILLFPLEATAFLALQMDLLVQFGTLMRTNLLFAALWALTGIFLAVWRLYHIGEGGGGAKPAEGKSKPAAEAKPAKAGKPAKGAKAKDAQA
ncbi:MAG: hypothetical protein WCF84_14475 [Anaerolineae bacterium]